MNQRNNLLDSSKSDQDYKHVSRMHLLSAIPISVISSVVDSHHEQLRIDRRRRSSDLELPSPPRKQPGAVWKSSAQQGNDPRCRPEF